LSRLIGGQSASHKGLFLRQNLIFGFGLSPKNVTIYVTPLPKMVFMWRGIVDSSGIGHAPALDPSLRRGDRFKPTRVGRINHGR
jgi:hypothetical protein